MPTLMLEPGMPRLLMLDDEALMARTWRAEPHHLVELNPAADGRRCSVTAVPGAKRGLGRCHVRAVNAVGIAVGHWYLTIAGDDGGEDAERQARAAKTSAAAEPPQAWQFTPDYRLATTHYRPAPAPIVQDEEPEPERYGP